MPQTATMLRWIGRVVLLRFLPRRLLPILTAVELIQIVRGLRKRQSVDVPIATSTAPRPPAIGPTQEP